MLNTYSYKGWFIEKEWDDTTLKSDEKGKFADLPPIPPLEGDKEEVKERTAIKVLALNKLLARLKLLLA